MSSWDKKFRCDHCNKPLSIFNAVETQDFNGRRLFLCYHCFSKTLNDAWRNFERQKNYENGGYN